MIDIYTEKKESKDWIIQNDLYFNLATFLQLLHFLCNKAPLFRDKYKGIIPNRISCKVAVYEETFCQRELGEHDERF